MNDKDDMTEQKSGSADTTAQSLQEPVIVSEPPPPRSREVKQDVVSGEQTIFEEETKNE